MNPIKWFKEFQAKRKQEANETLKKQIYQEFIDTEPERISFSNSYAPPLNQKFITIEDLAFGADPEETRKLLEIVERKKKEQLFHECPFCTEKNKTKLNELYLNSMVNPILGTEFYMHSSFHNK